jgi:hypothetical protein
MDCTIVYPVLSVHAHQANHCSLLVELLWVISHTRSTGAQPLVIYPGVLCTVRLESHCALIKGVGSDIDKRRYWPEAI